MAKKSEEKETFLLDKGITQRIKAIMAMRGMTLVDLVNNIPSTDKDGNAKTLTTATLSDRINRNPTMKNFYEIANALGVKVTELFPDNDRDAALGGGDLFSAASAAASPAPSVAPSVAPSAPSATAQQISTTGFCPHCGGRVKVGVVLMSE